MAASNFCSAWNWGIFVAWLLELGCMRNVSLKLLFCLESQDFHGMFFTASGLKFKTVWSELAQPFIIKLCLCTTLWPIKPNQWNSKKFLRSTLLGARLPGHFSRLLWNCNQNSKMQSFVRVTIQIGVPKCIQLTKRKLKRRMTEICACFQLCR